MMDYSEFKEHIKEHILEYLPENYKDADVRMEAISKNNGLILDGLVINNGESNVFPTIYVNEYFDDYEKGRSMESIMSELSEKQLKYAVDQEIDISMLHDFDKLRDKIVPRLVNAEKNADQLATMPHTIVEDLAIVYRISLTRTEDMSASCNIVNSHMEAWGVTKEELHSLAMENISSEMRPQVMSLREMLMGMMPDMPQEMLPDPEPDKGMFVVTSIDRSNGASVVLDPPTLDMVKEKVGTDKFFILPSSIHELMIVVDDGNMDIRDLENLVQEVNSTQVSEHEQLSDHVYKYDFDEKEIYRADKEAEHREKVAEKHLAKEVKAQRENKPSLKKSLSTKQKTVDENKAKMEPALPDPSRKKAVALS